MQSFIAINLFFSVKIKGNIWNNFPWWDYLALPVFTGFIMFLILSLCVCENALSSERDHISAASCWSAAAVGPLGAGCSVAWLLSDSGIDYSSLGCKGGGEFSNKLTFLLCACSSTFPARQLDDEFGLFPGCAEAAASSWSAHRSRCTPGAHSVSKGILSKATLEDSQP